MNEFIISVQFPLTKFLNVDYGLVSAPSVSAKDLQINVKVTIYLFT